jgi:2-methylcitrate dehydratase PrpD
VVDAQFSRPYAVARGLVKKKGGKTIVEYTNKTIRHHKVLAVAKKLKRELEAGNA